MGIKSADSGLALKFKQNYLSEIKLVVSFMEDKVKNGENITDEEVGEAISMFKDNLNKIKDLNSYNM